MDNEAELIIGTYEDYVVGYQIETIPVKTTPAKKKTKTDKTQQQNGSPSLSDRTCMEQSFAVRGHSGSVRALACSADGSLAFSAGFDEMTNLFSMKKRKLLQTLEGAVNCATFVENSYLICGCEDSNIYIYECKASNMTKVKTLKGHKDAVTAMDAHPSGKILLSISKDNTMRTWNLIKGRCAYVTNIGIQAHLIKWSGNGQEFVIAANNEIYLFNNKGNLDRSIKLEKRINSIEFITDNIFVVAIDSGKLELFDLKSGEDGGGDCSPLMTFKAHEMRIKSVKCYQVSDIQGTATTTNGTKTNKTIRLATASSDGIVKLWSITIHDDIVRGQPTELAFVDLGARLTCMTAAIR